MTDRLDAAALVSLRSRFESLKSRFQAMADRGSPDKAWLIHAHDTGNGPSPVYGWADGFDVNRGGCEPAATRRGMVFGLKDGRTIEIPPFTRWVQLTGYDELSLLGKKAARLLYDLPADVAARLWDRLPDGTELKGGLPLWTLAVFELANANARDDPLHAFRLVPWSENERVELESLRLEFREGILKQPAPSFFDWFSTLDNFSAASVEAIDILMSWLDAGAIKTDEPPKPDKSQEETLPGGGGAVEELQRTVASLVRQEKKREKPLTKTEKDRNQRIKFCCPRRIKKSQDTWNEIYHAYNKKFPSDRAASPDNLRQSHDRYCPNRPKCLSEKKRS